jgi:HAD superfamily hydrolase (TIGR01509 family)
LPAPLPFPQTIAGVVYDFDGTLADSFAPIRHSFNHMLRHFGNVRELTAEQSLALVGGPLEESVSRLLPPEHVAEGTAVFRSHYATLYLEQTHPMPGAGTLLGRIARSGLGQSVVTNKLGTSARELIAHFGWEGLLPFCLGEGDGYPLKPRPEMILAAAARMGVPTRDILFVGDSPFDFLAARAAGVRVCLLTTGTHSREELSALSPDLLFDGLDELGQWFFRESDRVR